MAQGFKTVRQSRNSSRVRNPAPLGCVSCFMFISIFFVLYFFILFFTWELVPFFYFFSTYYTPMEVVPPVGMLVYIAVYTLAADVLFLIHPRTAVCFNVG